MILTAHQPTYLPWLGLFHKIAISDKFCYFDGVQYQIKDWNNRNKIKTNAGPIWLTVPVLTSGYREKKICEIEINNSVDWRRKHWNSIYINYKKAPFFEKYASFFEDVYKRDWKLLSELNEYMLKWFLKELRINVDYCKASDLDFEGHKSDLVLDMCKKIGADVYIFGSLGKDYADKKSFSKENIELYFQDYKHPAYSQLYGDFVPYMSILDLMFNCGEDSLNVLMKGNVTKSEIKKLYGV